WSEDSPNAERDSDTDFEEPMDVSFDEPSVPRTPSPEDAAPAQAANDTVADDTGADDTVAPLPVGSASKPRRKRRKQQSVDTEAELASSEFTNAPKFDDFD